MRSSFWKFKAGLGPNRSGLRSLGFCLLLFALSVPQVTNPELARAEAVEWVHGADYDPAIPAPDVILKHPVGERPASVEEFVAYARLLAEKSGRVSVHEMGRSVEGDPLLLLSISAASSQEGLLQSRRALDFSQGTNSPGKDARTPLPALWIACGIHGDEASGCDAGLLLAYHLAADRSKETQDLLEHLLVLVDLCQNPDGRRRFLQHLRSFTRQAGGPDPYPEAIEHTELWPTGRFNHNLFDLNRDWAFLTQPETRARVAAFLRWRPQVFLDLHEMGSRSTYFFPPSALPHNPLLPEALHTWLELFGRANASAFDAAGIDYFVREQFDLFYPGYGDSWPGLQGAIGMTYEQGSSLGLRIEDGSGAIRSYRDAVKNHFLAALTSCKTSASKSQELLQYARRFHDEALRRARKADAKEILFDRAQAPAEARRLARLLSLQGVQVLRSERGFEAEVSTQESGEENKHGFAAGSYRIVLAQPSYPLLQNLLSWEQPMDARFLKEESERHRAGLRDRFYDSTAWSLPLAFGLTTYYSAKNLDTASVRLEAEAQDAPSITRRARAKASYGYVIPDRDNATCAALASLWHGGAEVYLARDAFRRGEEDFPAGSLVLKRAVQDSSLALDSLLDEVVRTTAVEAIGVESAWSDEGPSLGSNRVVRLRRPRIVVVGGPGVRPTSLGSVLWSLQEHTGVDCSTVLLDRLKELRLREVDVIVVPQLQKRAPALPDLRSWVEQGGTLVALGSASEALMEQAGWLGVSLVQEEPAGEEEEQTPPGGEAPEGETSPYPDKNGPAGSSGVENPALEPPASADPSEAPHVPGAILRLERAPYHFLCYGPQGPCSALVTSGRALRAAPEDLVAVNYAEHEPLIAGFAWPETVEALAGRPYLVLEKHEKGKVVLFAEDPTFRGIWPVTTRLLLNAVLLGPSLSD